jgi:hypothetical protein
MNSFTPSFQGLFTVRYNIHRTLETDPPNIDEEGRRTEDGLLEILDDKEIKQDINDKKISVRISQYDGEEKGTYAVGTDNADNPKEIDEKIASMLIQKGIKFVYLNNEKDYWSNLKYPEINADTETTYYDRGSAFEDWNEGTRLKIRTHKR